MGWVFDYMREHRRYKVLLILCSSNFAIRHQVHKINFQFQPYASQIAFLGMHAFFGMIQ